MNDGPDHLDAGLDGVATTVAPEVRALIDLAAEVARTLAGWRLSDANRELIYARATALADQPARIISWRRWRLDPRVSAAVGGAVVAAAAATAIGVAIARGRRQHRTSVPALAG